MLKIKNLNLKRKNMNHSTLSDFDYDLPAELIAQHQLSNRPDSKLLVVNREKKTLEHTHFKHFTDYLNPEDRVVVNNSKVIPARLIGKKKTGGLVEVFLVEKDPSSPTYWQVLLKGKNLKKGDPIFFPAGLSCEIINNQPASVKFSHTGTSFDQLLEKIGHIPLPPYIKRSHGEERGEFHQQDHQNYQTVYAKQPGSVAAPTAGLHFDQNTIEYIKANHSLLEVTLHVGLGTFLPVKCDQIADHQMHSERYTITDKVSSELNDALRNNRRIIAVGTTSFRTLESGFRKEQLQSGSFSTDLFIYPQHKEDVYQPKVCSGLLTNFHQPKSTLFMLICALLGNSLAHQAYQEAIQNKYRFFSYGDAMLII